MCGKIQVVNKYTHVPDKTRDVYIGRGSAFGNPFPINNATGDTRDAVCDKYEFYFDETLKDPTASLTVATQMLLETLKSGKDINLVCFCNPRRCHGDYIKAVLEDALAHYDM